MMKAEDIKRNMGRVTAMLWLAFLAATLPLLMASVSVSAGTDNWQVDGLKGELHVSGSLVSAPCILMPESQEQEISLGRTALPSLMHTGDVTVPVMVHVVLDGCPGGNHFLDDRQRMRGGLWLAGQGAVRMTVTGNVDLHDSRFFQVQGSASGVSLRLEAPDGELMQPGMSARPLPLYPGRNELPLKAQLLRNAGPLRAGEWSSVVQIGLEYE
ncbi:fimbrial protein [Serratia fonticola]|uniref:fimbrial protein n=1 Tax=Serratia fonticola TaxID=47917 RepID=UPI003AAD1063